jgi:hypothetical protein
MKWLARSVILVVTLAAAPSLAIGPPTTPYPVFDIGKVVGTRFQYMAAGGSDRCVVSDCLCEVSPPPKTAAKHKSTTVSRRLSVYFSEGSSAVSSADISAVREHVEMFKDLRSSYTVIGYTDDCGSHLYNMTLVKDRAESVKRSMKALGVTNIGLTVFSPEAGSGHNPDTRRVDVIAHTRTRVTTMIEKIQADVYLIDASGSMWTGWKKWSDVIAASFKPGSKIYLSKTIDCRNGQPMNRVLPAGGTEIWYSYWKVLEWMQPGQTLAIISDFRSEVPLTRREASLIEQKVRDRKIKVIAITP